MARDLVVRQNKFYEGQYEIVDAVTHFRLLKDSMGVLGMRSGGGVPKMTESEAKWFVEGYELARREIRDSLGL